MGRQTRGTYDDVLDQIHRSLMIMMRYVARRGDVDDKLQGAAAYQFTQMRASRLKLSPRVTRKNNEPN